MKNILITIMLFMVAFYSSGCATSLQHNKVQQNNAERRILASGDQEAIKLLNTGLKPRDVIKIRAATGPNGEVNGVMASVNLLSVGSLVDTFQEEPLLTTGAIALDTLTGIVAYKLLTDDGDSGSSSGTGVRVQDINGNGNIVNVVNGDNNSSNNDENQNVNGDSNLDEEGASE